MSSDLPQSIVEAITGGLTELWLHPGQEGADWVMGRKILTYLNSNGLMASQVDLDELKAIRAKDIDFYQKYFAGKMIAGWRGFQDGRVPCLCEYSSGVVLVWRHIDSDWDSRNPALRRK